MELSELGQHWDNFGKQDPLWAILIRDDARGGRWNEEAFFATGSREVASLIQHLDELGLPVARRRALDFGCGVGRITQALCGYFEECEGVDIAPSMIALAQRYNRHGRKCRYHVNTTSDLHHFANERFDLVYSNLVLQHMRPEFAQRYVEEFVRVLAAEGLAVFQIPGERAEPEASGVLSPLRLERLPDTAFTARVVLDISSLETKPAVDVPVTVRVRNTGTSTWPAHGAAGGQFQVNLGNHWFDERGRGVTFDDARAHLPHDLPPGEEVVLELVARAPSRPGRYLLELDMVQEGVAWFGTKGARPARIPVTVRYSDRWMAALRRCSGRAERRRAGAAQASVNAPEGQPRMEMHGVRFETVLDWVTSAGAHLVDLRMVKAAEAWPGFVYYVTKSKRRAAVDPWRLVTVLLDSILPPTAFQATLLVAAPPRVVPPGTRLCLPVTIKNVSPHTWPGGDELGRHEIAVGNHWLDDHGRLVVAEDGRSTLQHDLEPGAEATLVLAVQAPAKSGPHILEIDLVQEQVAWFSELGSRTTRIPILVR